MKRDLIEEMYFTKDVEYFSLERELFKKEIRGQNLKILDIGCGTGVLGAYFKNNQNCSVFGVEINEAAFDEAQKKLDAVIKGNIELIDDLPYEQNYFDFIVMGDVLEHLINPIATINKLFLHLKPGGKILITVPNIRYWKVLIDLIFRDKWEYQSWGILDYTHLRFFTRKSLISLLEKSEFSKLDSERVIQAPSKSWYINILTFGMFAGFLASHSFIKISK